jgi:tRNA-specific 2-thiouridylase
MFATTRGQLDMLRFPLGGMTKAQTRAAAQRFGLAIADKPDSQDICFVPTGRYASVIERLKPGAVGPGEIVHVDGRVLGEHKGIVHFTIGQRKGLGVATGEPLHVVRLDAATAQVVVGPRSALATRRIRLRDVNWLGDEDLGELPAEGMEVWVRVRSTRPPRLARLTSHADGIELVLAEAEDGVSPGQAAVFYGSDGADARVLGGGFISPSPHPRSYPVVSACAD